MNKFTNIDNLNLTTAFAFSRIVLNPRSSITLDLPPSTKVITFKSNDKFYVIPGNESVDFPQYNMNGGYQKVIFNSYLDGTSSTELDPAKTYTSSFLLDSGTVVTMSVLGSLIQTFNDLIYQLNITLNPYNGSGAGINNDLSQSYIIIYSATQTLLSSLKILDNDIFSSLPGYKGINKPVCIGNPVLFDIIPAFIPSTLGIPDNLNHITIQTSDFAPLSGGAIEISLTFYG